MQRCGWYILEAKTADDIVAEEATFDSNAVQTQSAIAEEAVVREFKCVICDRNFDTSKGLRTHETRMHKVSNSPIAQMDGSNDSSETGNAATFRFNSEYAEEDLVYTLDEYFSVSALVSREHVSPLSADHVCTVEVHSDDGKLAWPKIKVMDEDVKRIS